MLNQAPKTVLWAKHIEHDCRHRRVRRTSGSTLRIIGNEPNEIDVFSDGLRRLAESSRRYLKPKQSFQDGSPTEGPMWMFMIFQDSGSPIRAFF